MLDEILEEICLVIISSLFYLGVKEMLADSTGISEIRNSKFIKTSSSVRNINFWNTSSDPFSLMGLAGQVAVILLKLVLYGFLPSLVVAWFKLLPEWKSKIASWVRAIAPWNEKWMLLVSNLL